MKRSMSAGIGLALVLLGSTPCWAQSSDGPPGRIGNVWNGVRHQPTREAVRDAEKAGNDAQVAQRKAAEDRELDAIRRQLLAGSAPAH